MSDDDRIKLFQVIGTQWEMEPDTIEQEFGIKVKRQLNIDTGMVGGDGGGGSGDGYDRHSTRHLTDEEYYRRYGHARGTKNFLTEGEL